MKYLWIILLFKSLVFALPKIEFKNSCVPLAEFSNTQKEVLLKAYLAGKKEGFGLILAAIAWQESCAGEYKMNFQDPSAGNFHAYIPGVISRYPQLKQNGFTQNIIGARLVEDDEFATQIAIADLKFWKQTYQQDWKSVIKSYNKGYRWKSDAHANEQAENYYKEISKKITQLESYINQKSIQKTIANLNQAIIHINKMGKKDSTQYALLQDTLEEKTFSLPIYQVGNEFAAPLVQKKTIIKEFDLIEVY